MVIIYKVTPAVNLNQRYEKSSAEANDHLIMPRRSIFDAVKDTNFLLTGTDRTPFERGSLCVRSLIHL